MYPASLFFLTQSFWCLSLKDLYSFSSLNNGSIGFVVLSCDIFKLCIFSSNSLFEKGVSLRESRAAPLATKRWASSGIIISLLVKFNVWINLFLNSDKYVKGPPRNATFPLIGLPQARPLIVWFTTAWKIDAAMSSLAAPSFINGCISVFAKTPQREAIG